MQHYMMYHRLLIYNQHSVTMKQISLFILSLLCLPFFAQDRIRSVDSLFNAMHAEGRLNGNVLIAEKGKVVYQKSFGLRDETKGLPLDENSIFELASVSKQFTAMGIVLLKESGKLSYDDKLAKFFPELAFYGDITVRQLLNHTSGLPDYMELMYFNWDKTKIAANKDMIALLAEKKPAAIFQPGTKFEYSNTGYALLGSVIEKASGMSFGDYLQKAIFKPLGMANTFVYNRRFAPRTIENYAYGYVRDENNNKVLPDLLPDTDMVVWLDGIVGDGTVNSTTGDMLKWDRALYSDKLVPKPVLDEIFTAPTLPDGSVSGYGFGWFTKTDPDFGRIVGHSGGWPGYTTFIDRHIDNDKTIILLFNNEPSSNPTAMVRRLLYGMPAVVKRKEILLAEAEVRPFIGDYELAEGILVSITYDGGLKTQVTGQERLDLFAESPTKFFLKAVDAQIEFVKNDAGMVDKAILYQGGRTMIAPRVK